MSSSIDSAKTKAKEVAVEDFNKAKALAQSAARSGAYLYPIKGIFYFLSHRSLWKPLLSKLAPTMTLSLGVISFMFVFTYLPQAAVLSVVNGPLAAITTILLTLSESSTIITLLSKNFLIQDALVDTFDGVLVAKKQTGVLSEGRQLKAGNFNDPIAKLGKLIKSPFEKFTPTALIRYVMYLPLNFIPVVGTVIFVLLQGKARGNAVHTRYFQLKNWSNSQREQWLKENTAPYTAFGTIATLLELIPIASILFAFTNTVGAALWAADIESNNTSMTEMQSPKTRDESKKAA
ncbi:Outer spore wall protein [Lachnellula hyalina]|uniref:Outer spore wall protein n=1 Tax=Lachnellula hyalina TaxID=1316788 RepID=A0A8H8R6Y8_9HELO|nr:Outer spore wall protein [Lachnellula hyalina]TVY27964.1 Outer spore wall protein [Lachnellula hyalina]